MSSAFSIILNQYILNISKIYNPDVNLRLTYQMMCDYMFSDPKSDLIFSYFWLRTWLKFCFFSYMVIVSENMWDSTRDAGSKSRMTSLLTQNLSEKLSSTYIIGEGKKSLLRPYSTSICIKKITIVFLCDFSDNLTFRNYVYFFI